MSIEIKKLMNILIEKFGGVFTRENQRTYWVSPTQEKFHASTVFLRRMAGKPTPVKENKNVEERESVVNGFELQQSRGSEEVTETVEKVEEERVVIETPKKKKKSSKKKTESKVENEEKQGQENSLKEPE